MLLIDYDRTDYALPEEAVSEILAPTMAPRLPDGVVQKISRTGKSLENRVTHLRMLMSVRQEIPTDRTNN